MRRSRAPDFGSSFKSQMTALFFRIPVSRALRHRDFRLLFFGAMLSFTGSQIQNVAQGFYVYELTGDKAKLAMVMFFFTIPVLFLAPFSGAIADHVDRRKAMIISMIVSALGAAILAVGYHWKWLSYEMILGISFVNGIVQTVEAPARQSVVRTVVGDEDLPYAVPAQAMTFNLSRIFGQALGGVIASFWGIQACFLINALSFSALIAGVVMIKADLRPKRGELGSISDLLLDGIRFTFRHVGLRTLFLMESATAIFGMFYLSLMPAIANQKIGSEPMHLGFANSAIGTGALLGLTLIAWLSSKPRRPLLTRIAMGNVAIGLVLLSFVQRSWLVYPILGLIGLSSIMQFNTTNILFQLMSPENLRGRVISMHLWAISGLATIGIPIFGQVAQYVSLDRALLTGGLILAACAIGAWIARESVKDPSALIEDSGAA